MDGPTDEMYVYLDEDSRIIQMRTGLSKGLVLLGHSFWRADFAGCFVALSEAAFAAGKRTGDFWEWLVKDHLDEMPPFFFKRYANRAIVEVESFDESMIVLHTTRGTLVIRGSGLHLQLLSLDGGQVHVDGTVDSMTYEDETREAGGFFARLFG